MRKVLVHVKLKEPQLQAIGQASPDLQVVQELDPVKAREELRDAEVLLTFQLPGSLAEAPSLRWIQLVSAGAEHVLESVRGSDVVVTTASGIHIYAIAEYVLCSMVMLSRGIPQILQESSRREWRPRRMRAYYGEELHGKTLGILGLGNIGRQVAATARCLGLRVLGLRRSGDRGLPEGTVDEVYAPDGLMEMLPRCDFLVVLLPLTADTRDLIGERELRAMKPSSFLINVARGNIVQEPALVRALREGWIAGAAFDVFAQEPLPADSELWDVPNLIITPHMAGNFLAYLDRAAELFLKNLPRYLSGEPMVNVLDKQRGY